MRKSLIALVTLFAVTIQEPQRAQAGAFATEYTQLLNHAQLILQYLRQAWFELSSFSVLGPSWGTILCLLNGS